MKFKDLYKKARDKESHLLDEAAMWDVIESNLEKPKKKRRAFWLWFFGGISMFGLLIFTVSLLNSKNIISNQPSNPGIEELANSNPEYMNSYSDQDEVKEYSNESSSVPKNADIPTSSTMLNDNLTEENKTNNPIASLSANNDKILAPKTKELNAKELNSEASNTDMLNDNDRNINSTLIGDVQDDENGELEGLKGDISIIDNGPNKESTSDLLNTNLPLKGVNALPLRSSKILYQEDLPNPELIFVKRNRPLRLELVFNVSYLTHNNSITTNSTDIQQWADLHDLSNSPSPSFEVLTLLRYRWRNGLGIGLGLKARQISEWYNASVTNVEIIPIESDSASYATIEGIREYASGILNSTSTQQIHYRTPIRRFYIDLPIALSYRKSLGYFDLDLDLAYNFNISHRYSGRVFSEDLVLLDQTQINESGLFKSNMVQSANLGIGINYHWSESISLGLKANYWRQLSSSLTSIELEERYRGIGVGVFLEKRL